MPDGDPARGELFYRGLTIGIYSRQLRHRHGKRMGSNASSRSDETCEDTLLDGTLRLLTATDESRGRQMDVEGMIADVRDIREGRVGQEEWRMFARPGGVEELKWIDAMSRQVR